VTKKKKARRDERRIKENSTSTSLLLGSLLGRLRHCSKSSANTIQLECKDGRLTLASRLVGLINGLDDTDGNCLPHVTDGETTEGRIFIVRFDALRT
jgi:hypothetical protein